MVKMIHVESPESHSLCKYGEVIDTIPAFDWMGVRGDMYTQPSIDVRNTIDNIIDFTIRDNHIFSKDYDEEADYSAAEKLGFLEENDIRVTLVDMPDDVFSRMMQVKKDDYDTSYHYISWSTGLPDSILKNRTAPEKDPFMDEVLGKCKVIYDPSCSDESICFDEEVEELIRTNSTMNTKMFLFRYGQND